MSKNTTQNETTKITFSSDGIRGISGCWPFTKDGMYCIGQALSSFLLNENLANSVVLGRDTRPSGKEYVNVLKKCFIENGIKVVDLGIAPTPVVAYIAKATHAQLGVVISASHNPAKYNGIKLVDSNGLRLRPDVEKQIETKIEELLARSNSILVKNWRRVYHNLGSFFSVLKNPQQLCSNIDYVERYIAYHIDKLNKLGHKNLTGLRLVVDFSNGAVSRTGEQLLTGLGAIVIKCNNDMSGKEVINHNCGSEYYRKYPERLIEIVRQNTADYGFAFDGDGDRVVVVDSNGYFYNGDDLIYILAAHYANIGELRKNTVVITDNANSGLEKSLKDLGIKTVKTLNGDKNLEAEMWNKENDYQLGAEQVGNIIINDGDHGAADSLYAISLLFILLLSEDAISLKESILKEKTESLKKWPQVLATVNMADIVPWEKIDRIKNEMENSSPLHPGFRIKHWYSSTEPGLFNVMMEGVESDELKAVSDQAYIFCQKVLSLNETQSGQINIFDLSSKKRVE